MLANLLVIIGKVKSVFLGVVFCKKIRGVIITKTHIDSVHYRAGEFREVVKPLARSATATVSFAIVAARAWIRGGDQHERGGIFKFRP